MLTLSIVQEGVDNQADNTRKYRYNVRINYKTIASGTVGGHNRAKGWEALIQQILDERVKPERIDQIPP